MLKSSSGISANKAINFLASKGYDEIVQIIEVTRPRDDFFNSIYGGCIAENNIVIADAANYIITKSLDFVPRARYSFAVGSGSLAGARKCCYLLNKLYVVVGAYVNIYNLTFDSNSEITNITYSTRFGGSGTGDGQFTSPTGICTDGTSIFVCDDGGGHLQKFTPAGVFVAKIGSTGSGNDQFNRPWGCYYADGLVYVAEYSGKRINIRDTDLVYVDKFSSSGAVSLYGVCVSGAYIFLISSGTVYKHNIASPYALVTSFGTDGSGDNQFLTATSAIPSDGKLIIFDKGNCRIKRHLESDLSFYDKVGTFGDGSTSRFSPLINFPSAWTNANITTDEGDVISISPDVEITRLGAQHHSFKVAGLHTCTIKNVPKSEIKILDSNGSAFTNSWTLFQETPVASHGAFAYVWFDGSVYHEYYPYDSYTKIGHATSDDGKTFTVDTANNPVLVIGPSGTWDQISLAVPNVWVESGTWYMLYRGNGTNTCLATSEDGLIWTKYASNPVILGQSDPAGIMKVGSTYYLYANGTGGNRSVNIYTSTDLHTWTKQLPDPIFAGGRFCSCPFKFGTRFYLLVSKYYGAYGGVLELFEDTSPTFQSKNFRFVGNVLFQTNVLDTPCVVTNTIFRDTFPNNELWCYFSMTAPTYYLYLAIQTDIVAAINSAINPMTGNVML